MSLGTRREDDGGIKAKLVLNRNMNELALKKAAVYVFGEQYHRGVPEFVRPGHTIEESPSSSAGTRPERAI